MKNLKDLKIKYEIQGDYIVINNKDYLIQEGIDFISGQSDITYYIIYNSMRYKVD